MALHLAVCSVRDITEPIIMPHPAQSSGVMRLYFTFPAPLLGRWLGLAMDETVCFSLRSGLSHVFPWEQA